MSVPTLQSIQTPNAVETRLGTLNFRDGAPSAETAAKVYDHLDFSPGVEALPGSFGAHRWPRSAKPEGVVLRQILAAERDRGPGFTMPRARLPCSG